MSPLIPGLTAPLSPSSAPLARTLYNSVPLSTAAPSASLSAHIAALGAMLVRHSAHGILGVHLLHRHSALAPDEVMLGTPLPSRKGYWYRAAPAEMASGARGHMFMLSPGGEGWCAYDFVEGQVDAAAVTGELVREVTGYVEENGLEDKVGLTFMAEGDEGLTEVELEGVGTVMVGIEGREEGNVSWMWDGEGRRRGNESHGQRRETGITLLPGDVQGVERVLVEVGVVG